MHDINYQSEFDYAVQLTAQNKYQQAIAHFTRALDLHPQHFASLLNRGTLYSILQLFPLAEQDFSMAIALQPSDPTAYYNRFVVYVSTKRYKQGLADLYCSLSCLYVQKGVSLGEGKYFDRALALVESNHFAYIERAVFYRLQDQDKLAMRDLNMAIELDPTNRRALCLRCTLERAEEDYERAEKDHQLVLSLATMIGNQAQPLQIQFGDMPHTDIMQEIDVKLRELKDLRSESRVNVNVPTQQFAKSRSTANIMREESDAPDHIRVQERERQYSDVKEEQSLNAKLSKLITENKVGVLEIKQARQEHVLTKQESEPLLTPRNQSQDKASIVEVVGSERIDQQSYRGSKITSEIKKLAELVIEDQDLRSNKSMVQLPRTPQANTPEDRSLSSRTHGSLSQIIKPLSKKWFEVEIVAGALTLNSETSGNLSPYCTVIYENEMKTTKMINKAGKNPVWNESFTFLIKESSLLKIEVWDKQSTKKQDFIGSGSCTIYQSSSKCQLRHDNKPAGTVFVKVKLM